ncbi:MAG TPA: FimV/HubP family polar landmark protein, partial [Arenimonas sp.]|nr:FimV/HubP family polar landmark protein [Arenimonas sp.]
ASAAAPAPATADAERDRLQAAVEAQPTDLEAHVSLLRHLHKQRDRAGFESAAQAMRLQVRSTLDPRWREAVVMGVAMSPGNPLFSQAGWNTPRFGDTGVMPSSPPPPAAAAAPEVSADEDLAGLSELAAPPAPAHDAADEDWDSISQASPTEPSAGRPAPAADEQGVDPDQTLSGGLDLVGSDADFELDDEAPAEDAGESLTDEQAASSADDDASATKIELAKAYLEIGDVDGARGMLEEVAAEGGPDVRAEAERLLREIG